MEENCCRKKAVPRPEGERTRLIHRLSRMEGQLRGIRSMVENDQYCNDILIQCSAVNAALNAFERELLASHIRSCVADDLKNGNDAVVEELMTTLQRMMR